MKCRQLSRKQKPQDRTNKPSNLPMTHGLPSHAVKFHLVCMTERWHVLMPKHVLFCTENSNECGNYIQSHREQQQVMFFGKLMPYKL